MGRVKKRYFIIALFFLLLIIFMLANPTKQDYIDYTNFNAEQLEASLPEQADMEIERINFFLFSTYAPVAKPTNHYGVVHLGFMGNFFQISEGQYDYPWWLAFFN